MSAKKLLVIRTSLQSSGGNSGALVDKFVSDYKAKFSNVEVMERNFASEQVPHLTEQTLMAFGGGKELAENQAAELRLSDQLIAEIKAADEIVIGMPMYNFAAPSAFKSYIDYLLRAGITFRYTETGPQGMVEDKPVYILAARGGMYQGTPKDTQTNWLNVVFGFMGITDTRFVYAEGLAMGDDAFAQAMTQANKQIEAEIEQLA